MVVEIPPDQVPVVKKYKDLKTKSVVLDNSHVIVFNTKHKVLKDKRVRQALSLAIDRQKLIDALWNGETFTPNGHQLPAFGPTYSKERVGYRFDPEAAKKLLKESSYKGETVSYRIIPGYYTNSLEAAQIIQEMWKSIGFKIKLEPVENFKAIRAKGAAIYPWSNTFRYPDPAGAIYVLWGPKAPPCSGSTSFGRRRRASTPPWNQMLNSGNETERKKTFQKSLDIFRRRDAGDASLQSGLDVRHPEGHRIHALLAVLHGPASRQLEDHRDN